MAALKRATQNYQIVRVWTKILATDKPNRDADAIVNRGAVKQLDLGK